MGRDRSYYVYIMASHSQALYIGTTSDCFGLIPAKAGHLRGFTQSTITICPPAARSNRYGLADAREPAR